MLSGSGRDDHPVLFLILAAGIQSLLIKWGFAHAFYQVKEFRFSCSLQGVFNEQVLDFVQYFFCI